MKTAEDAARIMAVLNQRCSGIWPTHSPAPSASMPGRLSPRRLLLNQKVPLNSPLGSSLGRSPVGQKLQTSPLRRRSVSDTEAALANTTTDPADLTSGPGSDTEVGQVSALDKSSQQQQSSRADPTTLQCPFAGLNSLKSSPRSSSGCTALSAKCEKPNCLCPSSSVVEEHSEDAGCVLKLKMPRKMTDEDFNAGICHSEPGTPVLSRQNSCENLEVTVSNKPVVIAVTAATSPTPPCDNKVTQCAAKHTPHNSLSYPHSSFSSNPSSSKSRSNSSIARDSAHLSKKKKAVFSMSVFFTCLWRWRSSRKIYVTTVDE